MSESIEELKSQLDKLTEKFRVIQSELVLKNEVLENSLNGFDIVNSMGLLVYANKTYLKMWGYTSLDEIIGTPASDHCMDPTTPLTIIECIQKTGECTIEFKARRKDGTSFDVQMWARRAVNQNGEEFYPTTSIDISYRKTTEASLKAAILARDEFLSIASHELKTPLSALKLRNQMLLKKVKKEHEIDPQVMAKSLEENDHLMNRITQQINDMLDISRLNTGKFTLFLKEESLLTVFNKAVNNFRILCDEQGVSLVCKQIEEVVLVFDPLRIEQVIDNLLSNALKYGNKKPITLRLVRESMFAVISIEDQGIGIQPGDQARIFERYERAISANEVSGMGLGLFISSQIVGMHGGTLEVSSQPGEGSTFTIRLPIIPEKKERH